MLADLIAVAPREDLALPLPGDPRALAFAQAVQAAPDGRTGLGDLARAAGASLRHPAAAVPPRDGGLIAGRGGRRRG